MSVLVFRAFAVLLAFAPYVDVPGSELPVLLLLCAALWGALPFVPGASLRLGWPELLLAVFAGAGLLSVVATDATPGALVEYAAWLATTSVLVPLRSLPAEALLRVMRSFAHAGAAGALVGVVLVAADPQGLLLRRLSFAGYGTDGEAQYVRGTATNVIRLTGTYVEPNIAGLVLAVALFAALAATRGPWRVVLVVVIGVGLLLTLSRSAVATVAVAGLLVALVGPRRQRLPLLAAGGVAALGALAIPTVRERLLGSFGPNDTGSVARALALEQYPLAMDGHWWWGLGWDRLEYRDVAIGVHVNFVANAPLLTVYRAGLVVGAIAVLLLLLLVGRSLWVARRSFPEAVLACGVVGFVLVALQLDFPVVIQLPATAAFSTLVGFSLGRR